MDGHIAGSRVRPNIEHKAIDVLVRSAKEMRALVHLAIVLICTAVYASAQASTGVLWRAERVHYTLGESKPYYAWIILPVEGGATNGATFTATIDGIYRSEPAPLIKHVCLQSVHRGAAMQQEVMDRLHAKVALRKYPAQHVAAGRTYINSPTLEMRRVIEAALLQTSLVREMNQALLPRGLHIDRVSMEKLDIFSEKGAYQWDAIAWLLIDRAEHRSGSANRIQAVRPETNRTSAAAGSARRPPAPGR